MTQDQLADLLTWEGLTLQDYKDRLREQIILARLMNQAVRSRVSVDASEVEAYFKAHQDEFNQPAQARGPSYLFPCRARRTPPSQLETVRERASRVLQEARNGGDFASLAQRHLRTRLPRTAAIWGLSGADRRYRSLKR